MMFPVMLYLPPPESKLLRPPLSGWRRLVAWVSHPFMVLILLLTCLWMAVWPKKRSQLQRLRARVPLEHSLLVCVHVLAGVVLERWPFFVLAIMGSGAAIGLVLAGANGVLWGLGSSLVGASLAPVIADDVPPRWFRGHRGP